MSGTEVWRFFFRFAWEGHLLSQVNCLPLWSKFFKRNNRSILHFRIYFPPSQKLVNSIFKLSQIFLRVTAFIEIISALFTSARRRVSGNKNRSTYRFIKKTEGSFCERKWPFFDFSWVLINASRVVKCSSRDWSRALCLLHNSLHSSLFHRPEGMCSL